jgi:hypothetical protein
LVINRHAYFWAARIRFVGQSKRVTVSMRAFLIPAREAKRESAFRDSRFRLDGTIETMGKPVKERRERVEFDRKPAIGCGNEGPFTAHPPYLAKKLTLSVLIANMFQNGTGMDVIEHLVPERQLPAVSEDKAHPWVEILQEPSVIKPR